MSDSGNSEQEAHDLRTIFTRAEQLQRQYWTPNPVEKAALLARYPGDLAWPDLLRLHHLNCIDLLHEPSSRGNPSRMHAQFPEPPASPDMPGFTLFRDLTRRLLSTGSPFRARHVEVWQGTGKVRTADLAGLFRNASATHLGCLEVIRLDASNVPREVAFVPLDDLWAASMGDPALFRPARLYYDDSRPDEIVLLPLLYGISWFSQNTRDRTGSMTRYCCHLQLDNDLLGVGIGQQDAQIHAESGRTLFGLGSVAQFATGLELGDPRFDDRCHRRGIDPNEVRRQFPGYAS